MYSFFDTHASRVNPSSDATRFEVTLEYTRVSEYQALYTPPEASFQLSEAVSLTSHKRRRQLSEPIRIRSNYMQPALSAGKCARRLVIGGLRSKRSVPHSGYAKIGERAKRRRAGRKCGRHLFQRERLLRRVSDWFWFFLIG